MPQSFNHWKPPLFEFLYNYIIDADKSQWASYLCHQGLMPGLSGMMPENRQCRDSFRNWLVRKWERKKLHFLLFSKIVKILTLDIFLNQRDTYMFVKVVHENQSGNHCNQSNTQPSFLQELYQQTTSSLPHLEHTHTTHTLPLYCIFSFISVFWEPVKQNSSQNVSQAQVQES